VAQSSITSPSVAAEVSRGWCLVGTCDAKRIVPSSAGLPEVAPMVWIDHRTTSGSTAASFNESMRREAMTGTRTVFAIGGKSSMSSGAKNTNNTDKKWREVMSMKYFVASRTTVSKMLGIPGYL